MELLPYIRDSNYFSFARINLELILGIISGVLEEIKAIFSGRFVFGKDFK